MLDGVSCRGGPDRSALVARSPLPGRPLPDLRLQPDRQRQRPVPGVRHRGYANRRAEAEGIIATHCDAQNPAARTGTDRPITNMLN
jgi:hypothetical protein